MEDKELDEVEFKFGDNPEHYLEHTFRHLEYLQGQHDDDKLTDEQYRSLRGQLKDQYEELSQTAIDKAVVANMKKHQEYVERLEEEVGTMYDGNPPDWAESDGWRVRISQIKGGQVE